MSRDARIKITVSTLCARAREVYAYANDLADREADGNIISQDEVEGLRERMFAANFWLRGLEEAVRK